MWIELQSIVASKQCFEILICAIAWPQCFMATVELSCLWVISPVLYKKSSAWDTLRTSILMIAYYWHILAEVITVPHLLVERSAGCVIHIAVISSVSEKHESHTVMNWRGWFLNVSHHVFMIWWEACFVLLTIMPCTIMYMFVPYMYCLHYICIYKISVCLQ